MNAQHTPRLLSAAGVLFFTALIFIRLLSLPETDIFFAIYHGQNILQGSPIVAPDSWNFQSAGEAWTSNSWLWDVILALAYNAFGLIGVSLLNGASFALALWLAWLICARAGLRNWRRSALIAIFATASITFFTARAVNMDIVLLLVFAWLTSILRGKFSGWRQPLVLSLTALVLAAIGMNLHLAATAFVVLYPATSLILVPAARWSRRIGLVAVIGAGSAIGVLLTPYGLAGVFKGQAVADASRRYIIEWNAPNLATPLGWIVLSVLLIALALVGLLAWRRRYFFALLLLALDVAAFEAIRFTIYVLVFGLLLGGTLLTSWKPPWRVQITRINQRLILALAAMVATACAIATVLTYASPQRLTGIDPDDYAPFAHNSKVISMPSEGSAILFYRRDVQVAVDGRNDLLGAKRYIDATNTLGYASLNQLRSWLNQHGVDGAFLTTQQNVTLGSHFERLGWQAHLGRYGVAYTR